MRRMIEAEQFRDAALGVHDLTVNFAGWEVDEFRRKISDQRLEAQALFKFWTRVGLFRGHRIVRRVAKGGGRAKGQKGAGDQRLGIGGR